MSLHPAKQSPKSARLPVISHHLSIGGGRHPRDAIASLMWSVAGTLLHCVRARCPDTAAHSERVASVALVVSEELGYPAERREDLHLMGLLHDVGKLGIPDRVLKKGGSLSPTEYREIQSHVEIGVDLLATNGLGHLLAGVEGHHERPDGLGYPNGLSGQAIPLESRLIACCDAADAMAFPRVYRPEPRPIAGIFAALEAGAGSQWDADVVAALMARRSDVERLWRAAAV